MNSNQNIIANASKITVINDGQVSYPVMTEWLNQWIEKNGGIENHNYEAFCSQVDYIGQDAGSPGNAGMIALCAELIENGADTMNF